MQMNQAKKIGVISDTHIPRVAPDLPERVYNEFRGVDMILHAGDIVELSLLDRLGKIAAVHAVAGNMDTDEARESLPQKKIITVNGFKIGLIHGYGPPAKIVETVSKEFSGVDAIVFGHSHSPLCKTVKNVLFFNPGSPTEKIFALYNSFGILEVGEGITGRIIRL